MNNEIINQLTIKPLDIIENIEDRQILSSISNFLNDFMQPLSDIQIGKLVLNDIEYPTNYSKVKQTKLELVARYNSIVDIYYNIKKKEIELQLKDNEKEEEQNDLKKKLIELEEEKLVLQLTSEKARLNSILKEVQLYYKYYIKYNDSTKQLTDTEKAELEEEFWKKKALNNPIVFEERYGSYLKDIMGEDKYKNYLERRKISYGAFPRELV